MNREVALVVSGASGSTLARRFAVRALETREVSTLHIVLTEPAHLVLAHELGSDWGTAEGFRRHLPVADELREKIRMWGDGNLMADISSGSHRLAGVVVLPCSAGMAGAVAHGISRGLGQRVADVALKQRWPLVIGIRETPMSAILLDNLNTLARCGAFIVPPVPAYYITGDGDPLDRFIDHYCMRVLDMLDIPTDGRGLRWRG